MGKVSVLYSHSLEPPLRTLYLVQLNLANQNPAVSLTIFHTLKYPASLTSSAHHLHRFGATSSFLHSLYINVGWSQIYLTARQIMCFFTYLHLLVTDILEHIFMYHLWVSYFYYWVHDMSQNKWNKQRWEVIPNWISAFLCFWVLSSHLWWSMIQVADFNQVKSCKLICSPTIFKNHFPSSHFLTSNRFYIWVWNT